MEPKSSTNKSKISLKKRIFFVLITLFVSFIVLLIIGEVLVAIIKPQPYEYPALKFSEKYKKIYHSNVTIKSHYPPETRYYSTNELGFRRSSCDLTVNNNKSNIILLGDSFTFGIGVNDGFEFGSVMGNQLKQDYNVINLGIGGWGLTQEIRVFYEVAQSYNPEIAILFFFGNDPYDNLLDAVTKIKDGNFEFIDQNNSSSGILSKVSKLLSRSIIQKSNLYNFIRNTLYLKYHADAIDQIENQANETVEMPEHEKLYCDLLDVFVKDLNQKDVKLMFVSINYLKDGEIESELQNFPFINKHISKLDSLGLIDFVDINDWFNENDMGASPVSHYDVRWNKVLGENLVNYILSDSTNNLKD